MLRITRIDPEPFFTPNIHLVTHNDLFQANRRSLILLSERLWHGRVGVTLCHQVTQAVRFLILHGLTFDILYISGSPRLAVLRFLDWRICLAPGIRHPTPEHAGTGLPVRV